MGYSKDQLLARLQELQVDFIQYDHPIVLTVEAQAKYVGHMKGALSKNLFLKDKKHRFYIVSALADTKVDLKVLSQRLGLGKAGLRMAPEEALPEILQVPLGCVTPFALVNDSARNVSLMLDKGFKDQECCFFHPLSNDSSISLNAHNLDKFLKSIGKNPAYVDLEANPSVGKDQPPDLAALVPSDAIPLPEEPPKAAPLQAPEKNHVSVNNKSTAVTAKAAKPFNDAQKEKSTNVNLSRTFTDPEKFVEEILEKTSAVILSEIKGETIKEHGEQLGALVSDSVKKHLSLDLINLADRVSKKQIGIGRRIGDLYVVESLHLPLSTSPAALSSFQLDSQSSQLYLRHSCLGHLSIDRLRSLAQSGLLDNIKKHSIY